MYCASTRGLQRRARADCMAKLVAKSPNSFFGGISSSTSGKIPSLTTPAVMAAFAVFIMASVNTDLTSTPVSSNFSYICL